MFIDSLSLLQRMRTPQTPMIYDNQNQILLIIQQNQQKYILIFQCSSIPIFMDCWVIHYYQSIHCFILYIRGIMEDSNQITKLYYIMSDITPENTKEKRLKQFQTQLAHKSDLAYKIVRAFRNCLATNQPNLDIFRETIFVSERLASIQSYQSLFQTIPRQQIDNLGRYITQQNNPEALVVTINLIQKLFLERGLLIYSTSQVLFRCLLEKFIQIKSQTTLEIVTEIMVEMLLDNKKLIPLANNPYYFLEFWLHTINQESQLDRKLYWVESIKKLYSVTKSEQYLFYESDFRTLIDLLLRIISECPDGKSLRTPLQCYLVLACCQAMKNPIKIQEVKQYLCCLNIEELQIKDLYEQINNIK